jgi:hypothetical protein
MSVGGGPKNCNHNRISNVHVYGCNYGIDFQDVNSVISNPGGSQNTIIDGCHFECITTCINIIPKNSNGTIYNTMVSNCLIQKGQGSSSGAAIVTVDTNGGAANNVGPILLINNVIYSNVTGSSVGGSGVAQNNQYGVQIGQCSYVSIIGGQISQCGNSANLGADGSANICISGSAVQVNIDNVDLSQTYNGANSGNPTGSTGSGATQYGILISGFPQGVLISGCLNIGAVSVTGGATNIVINSCSNLTSVSVTGTVTTFSITNCIGYNTVNTAINVVGNITTGVAYKAANQGSNGGTNYYGPSFIFATLAAGTTVSINGGAAQTYTAGGLFTQYLNSAYDTFQFGVHAPTAIQWTGK